MIYNLDNKTITILEHIVFVAEKSAKQVQFCFTKGKKQYYINPSKDIFVSFELDKPITFDYPIRDLSTFLARAVKVLDSDKIKINKDDLVLPTHEEILSFESSKTVDVADFFEMYKICACLRRSKPEGFVKIVNLFTKMLATFCQHMLKSIKCCLISANFSKICK